MAHINLIATRRSERVRLTKLAQGLMIASFLVILGGIAGMIFMSARLIGASQRMQEARQELADLHPAIQELEADNTERAALRPKLDTLVQAQERTRWWQGLLGGLQRAVPERTWLTSLILERDQEQVPGLRIQGVAANQSGVGEAMYRLALQQDYYLQVDLGYTQTARTATALNAVEFEIKATLNLPSSK